MNWWPGLRRSDFFYESPDVTNKFFVVFLLPFNFGLSVWLLLYPFSNILWETFYTLTSLSFQFSFSLLWPIFYSSLLFFEIWFTFHSLTWGNGRWGNPLLRWVLLSAAFKNNSFWPCEVTSTPHPHFFCCVKNIWIIFKTFKFFILLSIIFLEEFWPRLIIYIYVYLKVTKKILHRYLSLFVLFIIL